MNNSSKSYPEQPSPSPNIIREGWLLKKGEHIKNWRTRYFVLFEDGSLLGFKHKPPAGQFKEPLNNFTINGCQIAKVDSTTHFIFVIRGLCMDQNIERNFSAGNGPDRDSWCNAILEIQQKMEGRDIHMQIQHNLHHHHHHHSINDQNMPLADMLQLGGNRSTNNINNNIINGGGTSSSSGSNNNTSNSNNNNNNNNNNNSNNLLNTIAQGAYPFGGHQMGMLDIVQMPKKMCLDDFIPIKLIGRGSWGKVMLSRHRESNNLFAVKILKKHVIIAQNEVGHTLTESRVLRTTNHPFLIALRYSFRDKERLCFVMEFAAGGELFYHLSQERKFSEDKAKFYGAEIVSALDYLHQHDIIYRDLKLENLLLDKEGHIKIADFGLCKDNFKLTDTTKTFCGTPEYLSPEVIEDNQYGRAVDWWSLGVLLYEMMCGQLPFSNRSTDVLFHEILLKQVTFPATLSEPAKHFLNGLLVKHPAKRLGGGPNDAREIMIHPFFRGLDWVALVERKISPPFVPIITSDTDTRYFDRQFTTEPVNLTPIDRPLNQMSEVDASFFTQFSYAAGSQINRQN